nr:hypothetical protein SYMBAF_100218 [Serratia symbiotica]
MHCLSGFNTDYPHTTIIVNNPGLVAFFVHHGGTKGGADPSVSLMVAIAFSPEITPKRR